ncbi:MAG: ABC transporter permease [Gemmatimonadaceae bacterium]
MIVASLASSVRVGLETLRANPLRAVLSTLGVIMGVASLVAVLAVGDGLERFGRGMIEDEGMQLVVVQARTTRELDGVTVNRDSFPTFTSADAALLEAALPAGTEVGMSLYGPSTVEGPRGGRPRGVHLTGMLPTPALSPPASVAAGRIFDAAEVRAGAPLIVLSHDLASALAAPDSAAAMLGATVRVAGRGLRVVGVQAPARGRRKPFLTAVVPVDMADALMLPSARPRVPQLVAHAATIEAVDSVKAAAERWAAARWPAWKDEVTISAPRAERIEQLRSGVLIFKLAMGAFTSISLLVGGIGIMNVLLASVTERTREIGIRRTVGARRGDILTQFLAESVVVSGVGSVLGAAIGLAGAFGVTALMRARTRMEVHAAFSWETLAVAALAALAVGLVFGTYPARRAARLTPIDAIRHE